jgi:1-acyl-sn-glycerol-3-phosphate acyltransferase
MGGVDLVRAGRAVARALATPADANDPEGVDPELIRSVAPVIDAVCRAWYRLEVDGFDRVPHGPALIVGAPHDAGISFIELLGWGAQWYAERGTGEILAGLGHDAMFDIPRLGNLLVRMGGIRASQQNADAIFARGRKAVVFPGGNLEAFRPWKQRNRIKLAGRKGFLKLALRHRVPIVPMVFSGGHESFVVLSDGAAVVRALGLKKLLRVDTWPLYLGLPWGVMFGPMFHLPLPTKVRVRMLDPIPTDGFHPGAEHDRDVLAGLYQTITGRMQTALTELSRERKLPVVG